MDYYKPHPGATFEGYYNKFDLPSGAKIVLIISRVPNAKQRTNNVAFTYIPADGSPVYQQEFWPETLQYTEHSSRDGFVLTTTDGLAEFAIRGSVGSYTLHAPGRVSFHASFNTTTPWSSRTLTPEGLLVHLPLPLHWHVQSLATPVDFRLSVPEGTSVAPADIQGTAVVHQEKNWAVSFPASHMWIQARADDNRGLCLAGGQILGMEAFLVGYRNGRAGVEIDFRPPFALAIPLLHLGPFMSFRKDWDARTFEMSVADLTRKLDVKVSAPKGTFYALSAPFDDGHRPNFLAQSMKATVEVVVWKRPWWGLLFGGWEKVCEDRFEHGSLEFGGEYYPPRGSNKTSN